MTKRNLLLAIALMSAMFFASVATAQTTTDQSKSATLRITRNNKVITKTTATDTIVAKKTTINQVSDSFKVARYEARLKGEQAPGTYFDNHNRDIEGKLLSRPFVELGGGATYAFSSSEFRPEVRLTLGWEMKPAIIFADFSLGWKGFSTSDDLSEHGLREGSEATGRYNVFTGTLNGALKVWQDARYLSYIAIFGGAGYSYAKTDGDSEDIRFSSSFYQLRWQGGVMAKYGFNEHWGVSARAYVFNPSNNEHDSDQDAAKLAVGAQVGVSYSF
jgi:hypothetical protein